MIILAIDIGLTGALAAVDGRGSGQVRDLPTTADGERRRLCGRGLLSLVREFIPAGEAGLIVIEDVRPRPMGNAGRHGNTMHSQGSLMRSRGIVEAVVDISPFELRAVQPATWKRHFGLTRKKDEKPQECKERGRKLALTLYPSLAADLARKMDHNRADALLIAHYGQGQFA